MIHVPFGMVLGPLSSSGALCWFDLDVGLNLEADAGIPEAFLDMD